MVALRKTTFWIIWTAFFGLASFLIIFFVKRVAHPEIDLNMFVKDGSIMFFTGALLGEASVGIMQKEKMSKDLTNFAVISSLLMLMGIGALYLIMFLNPDKIGLNILIFSLKVFIFISFILSFIFKYIYFTKK